MKKPGLRWRWLLWIHDPGYLVLRSGRRVWMERGYRARGRETTTGDVEYLRVQRRSRLS